MDKKMPTISGGQVPSISLQVQQGAEGAEMVAPEIPEAPRTEVTVSSHLSDSVTTLTLSRMLDDVLSFSIKATTNWINERFRVGSDTGSGTNTFSETTHTHGIYKYMTNLEKLFCESIFEI